jgi:hypothetical protein
MPDNLPNENHESQSETTQPKIGEHIVFSAAVIAMGTAGLLVAHNEGKIRSQEIHAWDSDKEVEFTVVEVNSSGAVLEHDGKKYTVTNEFLAERTKIELSEKNPNLKPFLENGPINVMHPKQ